MIAAAAHAEELVALLAPRMIRDAEALVGTVAWPDCPDGIAVIESADRSRAAFSLGSGHLLAQAIGCRRRPTAVIVGTAARVRDALAFHGMQAADAALDAARADVEVTSLHEAAHALVAALDAPADEVTVEAAGRVYSAPASDEPIARRVKSHGAAWAGAYAVLVARAIRFRPRIAADLLDEVRRDFHEYGLDHDRIAAAVAAVPAEARLRELATDTGFLARVLAVMPTDAERIAAIEKMRDVPADDVPTMKGDLCPC